MSKLLRIIVSALVALTGALVVVPGVASAGIGAGATPTFPQDPAINGVRVGEVYSASIEMVNNNTNPDNVIMNTVCNFGDTAPPCTPSASNSLPEDPGINLVLSCGQLGNDSICAGPGADPGVFQLEGSAVGAAGSECAGTVFNVSTTDPTFGTLRFEPNDGSNVTLAGRDSLCVVEFDYRVLRMPTIDSNPVAGGVQTIQITDNVQWSTTGTNASARGTTPGTTVLPAQPSIATTASSAVALGGGTISDSAVVSGRVSPVAGATITFRLYGPNDASCTGTPAFTSTVAQPVTGGAVNSEAYTPTAQGTYRWVASYSGDANNAPVAGACNDANESVVVAPGQPTITTTASAAQALGAGPLTDTATVTGRVGATAGGTVQFSLYGPNDATCSQPPKLISTVPMPTASNDVTSGPYTATVPGTYQWVASYSGDTNNLPASGACGDTGESTLVSKARPAITTDAGPDIAVGGQLTDKATVTGRVSPLASSVDFALYGPNDATCSGTAVFTANVPLAAGDTMATSPAFTTTLAGTYRWIATYKGDANNESVAGTCGEPTETVDVLPGKPVISTQASGSVAAGAGQLFDSATVTGRVLPQAGATISFRLYGPGDDTCTRAPVFESLGVTYPVAGGSVQSASYTPTVTGTYRWIGTYSGDANNPSVAGVCGDAAETVEVVINPDVELPATGSETELLLRSGGGLLVAGIALLGLSGRRRRPQQA